jgi:hypothetical protein
MPKFLSVFEKIIYWLVIFLLAFIPLYPKFPLMGVSGTFVSIRLEDLIIAFVMGFWLIYIILSGNLKKYLQDKLIQSILLFFFIGLVSLFSGIFVTQTVKPSLGVLHYLRRVEFIMLLPVVLSIVRTRKQALISLTVLSMVVLSVNIYAFGQQYLHWPVISTTNSEFSKGQILYLTPGARVNSTFAGHYDLAAFLVMALVIFSAVFFAVKGLILKTWVVILTGMSFVVLVLTAARQSFVAALIGITAALIMTGKKNFVILLLIAAVAAVAYPSQLRDRLVSTLTINLLNEGQRYNSQDDVDNARNKLNIQTLQVDVASREAVLKSQEATLSATDSNKVASDIVPGEPVDTTDLGVYRSFGIRFDVEWPRAIRAFEKNPLLGTGYSSLELATDNDILRMLGEVGLLGTLAFCLIFVELVRRIRRNMSSGDKFSRYFSAGVLAMILAFVLNAVFIDVFEASKVASLFWMFVGINLGINGKKDDL